MCRGDGVARGGVPGAPGDARGDGAGRAPPADTRPGRLPPAPDGARSTRHILRTVHIPADHRLGNAGVDDDKLILFYLIFISSLRSMENTLASLDLGHNEFTELPLEAIRELKVLNWLNLQK
ncbi:unnamed protein product [Diatraea saccharalis]|uniref:Uncharacterized protein n=1 Tax=Diatraea saccharalis TaxID=40085 RepID=A0A9N9WDK4_9NEOP|nr:unnamed protein product [Diatraea saccharalis]